MVAERTDARAGSPRPLGQILVRNGVLTTGQLEHARRLHEGSPRSLGRVLLDLGYITQWQLVKALAEQVGLEFVDLLSYPIDVEAVRLLPLQVARAHCAIPIAVTDSGSVDHDATNLAVTTAMADPSNSHTIASIEEATGRRIRPVVATRDDINAAIDRYASMMRHDGGWGFDQAVR